MQLFEDNRFDRFQLIGWWDQSRLARARVLVVGAGALGNEIVKNLALLGVGHVVVIDMDTIEHSNLTRSVLFRARDVGRLKCDVAVERARELWPDIKARAIGLDVINDIGAGVFRWADVVIGGLDNREARLAISRHCWRLGKPFIDGAIEVIQGVSRVFVPDAAQASPCYECTLSKADWQLIEQRRSCNMLTRQQLDTGHTPTTPTIASIIAGIQVQEAIKLLHGLDVAAGRGIVFMGQTPETYPIQYARNPSCQSHEAFSQVLEFHGTVASTTPRQVLHFVSQALSLSLDQLNITPGRDIIRALACDKCGTIELIHQPAGRVKSSQANCSCSDQPRRVELLTPIDLAHPDIDRPLGSLSFAPFDIIQVRAPSQLVGVELTADAGAVLGDLYQPAISFE